MNTSVWSKWLLKYAAIPGVVILALCVVWAIVSGPWGSEVVAGIALVLYAAVMINLKRSEIRADRGIAERIRAEYPATDQPQVLDLYNRLKIKELEYLFEKVLDDARGNLVEAKKLTGLAESVGWKAFLENRW